MIFIPFVLPLIVIFLALVVFAPVLAVASAAVSIFSSIVALLPARMLTRAKRTWVRVLGWLLICGGVTAALVFAGLAVLFTMFALTYGWPNSV